MSDRSPNQDQPSGGEPASRLEDPRNIRKMFWALAILCAGLFAADALYHKHVHFDFEDWFGFFGLFGFGLSLLFVVTARELRKFLMRGEDYYDR